MPLIKLIYQLSFISLVITTSIFADPGNSHIDNTDNVEWPAYGADIGYSRFSNAAQITPDNIHLLKPAWSIRSKIEQEPSVLVRTYANTPLMVAGTLFTCTPDEDILALDPETGTTQWRFDFASQEREHNPIRANCWGIVHHQNQQAAANEVCRSRLLHVTQMGELFAIDSLTGKLCPNFGDSGVVSFRAQEQEWFDGEIYNTTVPVVINDIIVVGNAPIDGLRANGPKGQIRAFDVYSGELLWNFQSIPGPDDPLAYATWAPGSAEITGAANVWSGFSADAELGLIYAPVATVAPDYYGGERLGDNLYANSLVALNAQTGDRVWHFQTVHHDIWDYDLPSPPLLVDLPINGRSRKAALQVSKMGMVFSFDRATGEPLHKIEERPVPQNALPGEVVSRTQPFPVAPPPLVPHQVDFSQLYGPTSKHKRECQALVEGMPAAEIYTPHIGPGVVQVPGPLGGANWGGASFDAQQQILVVPVMNMPMIMHLSEKYSLSWWQDVFGEIFSFEQPRFFPLLGTPYGARLKWFTANDGTPCVPPPWSSLVALNMSTGTIIWQAPLHEKVSEHVKPGHQFTLGGAITTAGGITFIAATPDKKLRAFETSSGKLLWQYDLPTTGNATPMSYQINGQQYLVVAAGGSDMLQSQRSDYLLAFKLDLSSSN